MSIDQERLNPSLPNYFNILQLDMAARGQVQLPTYTPHSEVKWAGLIDTLHCAVASVSLPLRLPLRHNDWLVSTPKGN